MGTPEDLIEWKTGILSTRKAAMRIALYVPAWPPGAAANGIVSYASHLVPALRAIGHEVFVLTSHKTTKDPDPYTVDLKQFGRSPLWQSAMLKLFPETAQFNAGAEPIAAAVKQLTREHAIDILEIENRLVGALPFRGLIWCPL